MNRCATGAFYALDEPAKAPKGPAMDIARTPSTPDGNPEMADAAPEPKEPLLIRREDYTPFAWLVPEVSLEFDLGLDKTRVRSALTVQRNAKVPAAPSIRLNGDGLTPLEVVVDGQAINSWSLDGDDLIVPLTGDTHHIEITTEIDPSANSQLMGLYASNGMLCTQCEAEGFRRITFFPDRPDVLSTYRVRMSGPKDQFPVLLCNGNLEANGENADGTHWAEWHDPWPKPCYLFALVAGDLVANRDSFTTMSGREVDLGIWVREGDLERTQHAMDSLKRSMKWDEETFGREYDLDTFNVVAVSDFNMGAMENKGLNVFNTKYVLADTETATDGDYDAIEGVIGHEYFHNWSGNRVTCRDWFQLSLKEGFTVLRDQLFSQDMGSRAGQADRGRARAARGAVPRGFGPAGAPDPARQLPRDLELLHRHGLQQGRRSHPHDAHDGRARAVPRRLRPLFRAPRRAGGDLRGFHHARSRTGRGSTSASSACGTRRRARPRSRSGSSTTATRPPCTSSRKCRRRPASRTRSRCRFRSSSRCSTGKPGNTMVNNWLRSSMLKRA